MKRVVLSCFAIGTLAASAWVVSAASTNFSGTWVLDKSKSEGLPRQLDNVESYALSVTQSDQELTVETKVTGGRRPDAPRAEGQSGERPGGGFGQRGGRRPDGDRPGGGGRGGRGGFGMGMGAATYKLDGSETKSEGPGGRGAATFKAAWMDSGKSLELTTTRSFNFQGNEGTRTIKERWALDEGGKVLKIKRTADTPQGAQESTLVFNRQ